MTSSCDWTLARLSIPSQRILDHLDRVVAGCCWKILATRLAPNESQASLRRTSKRITMMLAFVVERKDLPMTPDPTGIDRT